MFLVTGGNGFVGSALVEELALRGNAVRSALRSTPDTTLETVDYAIAPKLERDADWSAALDGVSTVIHTAARVHIMRERSNDALSDYRSVNVEGTLSLARQAAKIGVKRFVFLSSIKVNSEETKPGKPYTEYDTPAPKDAYGQSKLEAELGLHDIANQTGMEIVILRPTMIYGLGVKGNFARLIKLIALGIPLPLKSVDNRRSMISLKNCVDLIICAAKHDKAAGQTFLMSDGEDLSTPNLIKLLGWAMHKPVRLFAFPPSIMSFSAAVISQRDIAQRLIGNLQVDISRARQDLNWTPVQSVKEGLIATVQSTQQVSENRNFRR